MTLVPRKGECLVTDVENGDKTQEHYGLAVDYGSTTILMQAVDMETGQILAEANETNGQAAYGADILTRITYGLEGADRKKQLRLATVETFHKLLDRLTEDTGRDMRGCPVMVISGNTTMVHFLLELDAWTVFFRTLRSCDLKSRILFRERAGNGFWRTDLFYTCNIQLCGRRYCKRTSDSGFL